MNANKNLEKFIVWRDAHISHRQMVYILSLIIGIISGLAAVLLKNAALFTHELIINRLPENRVSLLYFLTPLLGIGLAAIFVRFIIKDDISHGISKILFSISKQNGRLRSHNMFSSLIGSILTVGFGGSVGLEAPIVLTGSSYGSVLGRIFKMNYKTTIILIGCGAAGAIAGIFKAPIAAVLFSLEVLMLDLTLWSIIPLLISAVAGLTISYFFLGKAAIFTFELAEPFNLARIPYYIVLGIFCGLVSLYFTKGTLYIEGLFGKIKNLNIRPLLGGLLLGLMILFLPPLYGEGYNTLDALLNGNVAEITNGSLFYGMQDNLPMFGLFLFLIIIFKVVAMAVTNGAGGVGGIFAPSLFMGGISGYFMARLINFLGFAEVSERNFSLVGMAGMMAGVMHAPLTAIFLIAEITGGYGLLLPLIITATIAFITIYYFEPHSIYTIRLAQRGELITHDKDKAVLILMDLEKVIEKDFIILNPNDTLEILVDAISRSNRNMFPVISDKMLVGIVLLDDIRHIIFNTDMYKTTYVRDLMMLPPAHVSPDDSMEEVMKKFEETGSWNLPVIKNGRYVGFLSRSKLFSVYRKWLMDISAES
jgi:chloride channel protein, CIC family